MSVYIYNSLAKKKEEFSPLNPPKVNIYTCGVTVYDDCHIGHARSLYIFDVIRKYLKHKGYKVNFVRNITDIDDKIINKSRQEGCGANEVAQRYIESYHRDLKALSIEKADFEPQATENIAEMIQHIQGLIDGGFAYEKDGDVYFSVRKFSGYGKLSGQDLEQMMSGARIEKDESKNDPLDFALWKKSKEGEPKWPSPWGLGRPGWHIECSVMSQKYLKADTLDIHAGGRDLIFPHHENEIAQSEAKSGKPFSKYWIHHGLLTINAQKMSKSLGNFITISDFIQEYGDADILKLFFLSAHYSQSIDFNAEKIQACRKQKKSFDDFFEKADLISKGKSAPEFSENEKEKVDAIYVKFEQAMDNDFNMPQALSHAFELRDLAFNYVDKTYAYARSKLEIMFKVFGLKVKLRMQLPKQVIKEQSEREKLKRDGDYEKADEIRNNWIRDLKLITSDTSLGVTFTKAEE